MGTPGGTSRPTVPRCETHCHNTVTAARKLRPHAAEPREGVRTGTSKDTRRAGGTRGGRARSQSTLHASRTQPTTLRVATPSLACSRAARHIDDRLARLVIRRLGLVPGRRPREVREGGPMEGLDGRARWKGEGGRAVEGRRRFEGFARAPGRREGASTVRRLRGGRILLGELALNLGGELVLGVGRLLGRLLGRRLEQRLEGAL